MDTRNGSFTVFDDGSERETDVTTSSTKVHADQSDILNEGMVVLDSITFGDTGDDVVETRGPSYSTPPTSRHASPRQGGDDDAEGVDAAERARREEEESISLAQQLMAEEAMASYAALSIDFLRHNRDQFSAEDLAALQAAMDEDQEEPEEGDNGTDGDGGMSYELMLRLGEQVGDVKTERWTQVARGKIDALPLFRFDPETVRGKDVNDCDVKCLVCQQQYEKGELLRKLPCGHCFHAESCVDQWLLTKDFCPYCRDPIMKN